MRTVKAALNLPGRGKTNKYTSMLLWSPWTELERVNGEQEEDETEEQKHRRLIVFPKSIFPVPFHEDDSINMPWTETLIIKWTLQAWYPIIGTACVMVVCVQCTFECFSNLFEMRHFISHFYVALALSVSTIKLLGWRQCNYSFLSHFQWFWHVL